MANVKKFAHHDNAGDLFPSQAATAIKLARRVAEKSQYGASKVACLIYDSSGICVTKAVNGVPKGVKSQPEDFVNGRRNFVNQHAERAALQLHTLGRLASIASAPDEGNLLVCTHPICALCAGEIISDNANGIVKISSILLDNRHIGLRYDDETATFVCQDPRQYAKFLLKWSETTYFAGGLFNRANINIPVYVAELIEGKRHKITIAQWHGVPKEHHEYIRALKLKQHAEQMKNKRAKIRSLDGYDLL